MEEIERCPFCGVPLELDNRPWSDGHDGWEFSHVDMPEAIRAKCPLVMECYDTEEEAIAALNARAERTCKVVNGKCSNCGDKVDITVAAYCRCCGAMRW